MSNKIQFYLFLNVQKFQQVHHREVQMVIPGEMEANDVQEWVVVFFVVKIEEHFRMVPRIL